MKAVPQRCCRSCRGMDGKSNRQAKVNLITYLGTVPWCVSIKGTLRRLCSAPCPPRFNDTRTREPEGGRDANCWEFERDEVIPGAKGGSPHKLFAECSGWNADNLDRKLEIWKSAMLPVTVESKSKFGQCQWPSLAAA